MAVTPNVKTTNNYFDRTETLVKYYHDVNEYSVIDAAREKELFMLLDEGRAKLKEAKEANDRVNAAKYEREVNKLRDFIINSNLRFVISIARVYATNNNILDIINEGNIGLIEAVDTFDVTMGNRFQTHAVYLIRQKINLFKQNDGLMIRKNNESKTYHIKSNMTNKFIQEFQREPTTEELKDYINEHYPNAKIKDSSDVLDVKVSSIDEPVDNDDVANVKVENAGTTVPRAVIGDPNDNDIMSDRYIEDGSFLRIKNVSLGYTFPKKLIRRFKLENLRVYCNIQNLYTFTKYNGYDPEVGASTQNVNVFGCDNGRYPTPTTYSFGINIAF